MIGNLSKFVEYIYEKNIQNKSKLSRNTNPKRILMNIHNWLHNTNFLFFFKHRDALIVPLIDCLTSFFSGFVIFTVLGAMAKAKGVEVADVATGGINVYSIVYLFKFPTQILRPQEQVFFLLQIRWYHIWPKTGLVLETVRLANVDEYRPTKCSMLVYIYTEYA